jgi:hypothetical protein
MDDATRSIVRQWTGVLLPSFAILFDINLSYILVQYSCFSGRAAVLWLVTIVTLAMVALSAWYSRRVLLDLDSSAAERDAVAHQRARFLGIAGLSLTALALVSTIMLAIPKAMVPPC